MMKPIFTTILLLVFIAGTVSAQSIDELNSRRIKEQEKARLYNYSSTHKKCTTLEKVEWICTVSLRLVD